MSNAYKVKTTCKGILDTFDSPVAVLVATVQIGREKASYVLLTVEQRNGLWRWVQAGLPAGSTSIIDYEAESHRRWSLPVTIPTCQINVERGEVIGPIDSRHWINGESMWVRLDSDSIAALVANWNTATNGLNGYGYNALRVICTALGTEVPPGERNVP